MPARRTPATRAASANMTVLRRRRARLAEMCGAYPETVAPLTSMFYMCRTIRCATEARVNLKSIGQRRETQMRARREWDSICRLLTVRVAALVLAWTLVHSPTLGAQQPGPVQLTLQSAVELAMDQSYNVRQLQMSIEQTRSLLKAERARLKTRIDLELSAPEFEAISDYEWNSELGRNELVQENSRRWEANLSVRQPVILFGYPTNGYLSFNTRFYRYTQLQAGEPFTRSDGEGRAGATQPLGGACVLQHHLPLGGPRRGRARVARRHVERAVL